MYRQICCHFWTDPKVQQLDQTAKLLFLYLITCPYSHFSGIYYLPPAVVPEETKIKNWRYPMDTLSIGHLAYFETDYNTIWVKNMLKFQGTNAKHIVSIGRHLQTLHFSPLIKNFLEYYDTLSIAYQYPIDRASEVGHQEQEQEQDKEKEQKTPIVPLKGDNGCAHRFSKFWAAYPRKVGKEKARQIWCKKLKPSDEMTDRMLKAIEQQKATDQWQRENGQFIPHPSTWLNRGSWDDEIEEWKYEDHFL